MIELLADKPVYIGYSDEPYPSAAFHSHPFYEIYYFHEGACNYLIGDQIYSLQPGDLLLMHGMTLHAPKVRSDTVYRRTIIHFDPSFAAELIRPFITIDLLAPFKDLGNLRLQLDPGQQSDVEAQLARLCKLQDSGHAIAQNQFVLGFLHLLCTIYELCAERNLSLHEPSGPKEQIAQAVVAYIEQHYQEEIHMENLQQRLHINKSYIAKAFKEVTGFTIFNYLYQRRINQAKILLLLNQAQSITDTCYEVGFKHPSHFTRVFKNIVGMTPELYKQSVEGG